MNRQALTSQACGPSASLPAIPSTDRGFGHGMTAVTGIVMLLLLTCWAVAF
jgi:hypothetical protein